MKQILGPIIEIIGVVILIIYSQMTRPSNTILVVALVFVLLGLFVHVILNKFSKN